MTKMCKNCQFWQMHDTYFDFGVCSKMRSVRPDEPKRDIPTDIVLLDSLYQVDEIIVGAEFCCIHFQEQT